MLTRTRRSLVAAATLVLSLLVASSAQAVTFEINGRIALGGNDFIDWGPLGLAFTVLTSPLAVTSSGGVGATVSTPGQTGNLERRDQGNGWAGNFAAGDALIWNLNAPTFISITFNTPVAGAGAQVQPDSFGSFAALVQAFDTGNNIAGQFSQNGVSSSAGDNSAIFLGVLSDTANISQLIYFVSSSGTDVDFALNRLDLVISPGPFEPIPEPGTFLLLATSLAGIGVAGWKRRSSR